jgi:hypothetical protein
MRPSRLPRTRTHGQRTTYQQGHGTVQVGYVRRLGQGVDHGRVCPHIRFDLRFNTMIVTLTCLPLTAHHDDVPEVAEKHGIIAREEMKRKQITAADDSWIGG